MRLEETSIIIVLNDKKEKNGGREMAVKKVQGLMVDCPSCESTLLIEVDKDNEVVVSLIPRNKEQLKEKAEKIEQKEKEKSFLDKIFGD